MALETATYLDGLVPTNPAVGDLVSAGDDHIWLLKSTLKATFPSLAGPVIASHTDLSTLSGITGNVQLLLDGKAAAAHTHDEAEILDGNILARVSAAEVITGIWNFSVGVQINGAWILTDQAQLKESKVVRDTTPILARLGLTEQVTAQWNFLTAPLIGGLGAWRWSTGGLTSGRVFAQAAIPAPTGTPGDIVLVLQAP